MKSSPTVDACIKELDSAGVPYRIEWTKKHVHVRYGQDYEHLHICASTPSDYRAPLNERGQIRKELREHGLIHAEEDGPREIVPVFLTGGAPSVFSNDLAQTFGKPHKDVLRAIDRVREECGAEFDRRNFAPIKQTDSKGREQRAFRMTRDGYSLVAMGFTGSQAMRWKVKFLEAFNAMEAELASLSAPRSDIGHIREEMDALVSMMGDVEARVGSAPKSEPFPYWVAMTRMERRRFERRLRRKSQPVGASAINVNSVSKFSEATK
jgi:Rha family phage regulatory protein